MERDAFVATHPEPMLIKRPGAAEFKAITPIGYDTSVVLRSLEPAFAASWQAYPVRKAPGNPYADRISVGRAKNCDIVVRVSQLSKLHAHITRGGPTGYLITDNDSSNGTAVDGVQLTAKAPTPLPLGCTITFSGMLELEFVRAVDAHAVLRTIDPDDTGTDPG